MSFAGQKRLGELSTAIVAVKRPRQDLVAVSENASRKQIMLSVGFQLVPSHPG